ncbi:uncharacterized protein LOC126691530 [Quercus robur]|uniref:uncharacterized protein LOC126691530 n=1 Tax=Quercus robur TaxID=38942 RepID=UPI002163207B|nr:uncharacterized protein LOC126691530 [Quercus robur]
MRAFLCSIGEVVWDAIEIGWTKLKAAKSTWNKAALVVSNANSKALNAIFCGVSPDEFHWISHITVAQEAWQILETTYEGIKKVKDTKLQMLTTRFEELRMSKDESFDSFYSKLNEVVIGKFNLGEKTEDSKVVRKILRSLPESFHAKVTTIEESKDLDEIKVQELIGSLHMYELSLPNQRKSKSLALKTINEKVEGYGSSDEDTVEKDVAYLAKNFCKFLEFKNSEKFGDKGKFMSSRKEKKDFKKIEGKESQSTQDVEEDEDTAGLKENYNSLFEKSGEYARVAKATVKKMKKVEEDYKSLLVRYKEAKCEIETLNGELTKAYTKDTLVNISKEVKIVKAKELVEVFPTIEKANIEKKKNVIDQRVLNKPRNQSVVRFEGRSKSPPRSQRGPGTNHVCHHCGLQGHTRPNCHKLRALRNAGDQRSRRPINDKRTWDVESSRDRNVNPKMMDVMKMIGAFTNCWESFTRRFESPNSRT